MSKRRSRPEADEEATFHAAETVEWGRPSTLVVGLDCRSMNLYRFLRVRFPGASRTILQRWIQDGKVALNGHKVSDSRPLRAGDIVDIHADVGRIPSRRRQESVPVLYEDAALVIVAKPAGMAVAPERHRRAGDLLSRLRKEETLRGGTVKLVHRIDKAASGLVVFARTREAKRALIEEFAARRVRKDYLALVSGWFPEDPVLCEEPLSPVAGRRPRVVVTRSGGKPASTELRAAWRFRDYTVVHARPVTGRTHQIRVHLKHGGNAIVGDSLYGGEEALYLSRLKPDYRPGRGEEERPLLARLALHAYRIRLKSPESGPEIECVAPLPRDLLTAFKQLQKHAPKHEQGFARWLDQPLCGPAG